MFILLKNKTTTSLTRNRSLMMNRMRATTRIIFNQNSRSHFHFIYGSTLQLSSTNPFMKSMRFRQCPSIDEMKIKTLPVGISSWPSLSKNKYYLLITKPRCLNHREHFSYTMRMLANLREIALFAINNEWLQT